MKIFNIFKKDKPQALDHNVVLFFHEDDYCQVEISPNENLLFFKNECDKINEQADKSFDGYGYSDIYVRGGSRVTIEKREIRADQLEEMIILCLD